MLICSVNQSHGVAVERQNVNLENTASFMIYAFTVIGSYGFIMQNQKIWFKKPRSVESISGLWAITNLAMFTTFFIRGLQNNDLPYLVHGGVRAAFLFPVVVGFWRYNKENKERRRIYKALVIVCLTLLTVMWWRLFSSTVFIIFQVTCIGSGFMQAYTIYREKSRGRVALQLPVIILGSIICWEAYAVARGDVILSRTSAGFICSYVFIITAWIAYPNKTVSQKTS